MCGRFTLTHREARALAAELGVSVDDLLGYRPRYNIAPTDDHWIVRTRYEDRQVLPAKWGLINFWMTDRKQAFKNINARAETVRRAPAFRDAFASRRCVVPADGFFEWTGPKEGRRPIWFHRPDGGLILFATREGADLHDHHDHAELAAGAGPQPDAGGPRGGGGRRLALRSPDP